MKNGHCNDNSEDFQSFRTLSLWRNKWRETYTSNSLKISTCKKNQKEKKKDLLKISACNSTLLILEFYEIESAKNNSGSHQHFNFWYWVFHFSEQAQKELIKKIEEQRKRWPCEGHLGAENDIILLCHEE